MNNRENLFPGRRKKQREKKRNIPLFDSLIEAATENEKEAQSLLLFEKF